MRSSLSRFLPGSPKCMAITALLLRSSWSKTVKSCAWHETSSTWIMRPHWGVNRPKFAEVLQKGFYWSGLEAGMSPGHVPRKPAHQIRRPRVCWKIDAQKYRRMRRWHPRCYRSRSSYFMFSNTLVRFCACCCEFWLRCLQSGAGNLREIV